MGFAQALIGNPEVLILDEPTVGLDPKQIIDIRNLIKSLGDDHTIILSSHILPEIQAICDRVVIINNGVIVADDTADNLSKNMSEDFRYTARIEGPEEKLTSILQNIPKMVEVTPLGEKEPGVCEFILESEQDADIRRDLFDALSAGGYRLLGLKSNEMTLEDIFLRLTSGDAQSLQVSETQPDGQQQDAIRSHAQEIAGQFFEEDAAAAKADSAEDTDGGEE